MVFLLMGMVLEPDSFKNEKRVFSNFELFMFVFNCFFENVLRNGSGEVGGGPYLVKMIS